MATAGQLWAARAAGGWEQGVRNVLALCSMSATVQMQAPQDRRDRQGVVGVGDVVGDEGEAGARRHERRQQVGVGGQQAELSPAVARVSRASDEDVQQ